MKTWRHQTSHKEFITVWGAESAKLGNFHVGALSTNINQTLQSWFWDRVCFNDLISFSRHINNVMKELVEEIL